MNLTPNLPQTLIPVLHIRYNSILSIRGRKCTRWPVHSIVLFRGTQSICVHCQLPSPVRRTVTDHQPTADHRKGKSDTLIVVNGQYWGVEPQGLYSVVKWNVHWHVASRNHNICTESQQFGFLVYSQKVGEVYHLFFSYSKRVRIGSHSWFHFLLKSIYSFTQWINVMVWIVCCGNLENLVLACVFGMFEYFLHSITLKPVTLMGTLINLLCLIGLFIYYSSWYYSKTFV